MSNKQTEGQNKWMNALDAVVQGVVMKLKRREIQGSGAVATQTAELLRTVVARGKYRSVQELLDVLRNVGKTLANAQPNELAIGNTVRRVLFIVRHECVVYAREEKTNGDEQQANIDLSLSLHKLLDNQKSSSEHDFSVAFHTQLKQPIIEEITQLVDEVKNVYLHISEQAVEHIYAKEVILTFGISRTVLNFLKEAAKFREYEVIVAESAPTYEGQKMAVQLADCGISTTVITDSAVFAIMAHVNKVIIGVHGVMANGGLIAHTGAYNLAVAAKHHSVPFVVVTGLHKLCPLYAFDQDTFNVENAPSQVLKFEEEGFHVDNVNVMNPGYDYIEPNLVKLFITNFGGHNPSYIYRLLAEYYDPEDYEL